MPCDHITKCNKCSVQVCSYCVEDCSGCQEEWCKECYIAHQECCMDCEDMICPKEIEVLDAVGDSPEEVIIPQVCPQCNMKNPE